MSGARKRVACAARVTVVLAALLTAAQAGAQEYSSSLGWGGGYISFSPFVEQGEHSAKEIRLSPAWVAVLQGESWVLNRWLGLRLGGIYSRGTVTLPTAERSVAVYGLETAALLRILSPAAPRKATAYLVGGGGVLWYCLGQGGPVRIAGTGVLYDDGERRQFMALGGGGIELMPGLRGLDGPIGVRLEVVDQVMLEQPFRPLEGAGFGATHNPRLSITLFAGLFGAR
jgi:hypothetical protein